MNALRGFFTATDLRRGPEHRRDAHGVADGQADEDRPQHVPDVGQRGEGPRSAFDVIQKSGVTGGPGWRWWQHRGMSVGRVTAKSKIYAIKIELREVRP